MEIKAENSGFVEHINTSEIGMASLILGGGRETTESLIDLAVGIVLNKKVGDRVEKGDVLATLYANDIDRLSKAKDRFMAAYSITKTPVAKDALIKWIITNNEVKKY